MLEHDISATSLYVFRQATLSIDDGAHKKLRSKLGPKQPGPPEARDQEPHQISKRAYFEE